MILALVTNGSLDLPEVILRVVAAGVLGGLIGLERELSGQPAGFRTHILVSLGAVLFTLVGAYGVKGFSIGGVSSVSFDPTRIAAQVVTGIGFLGAGAIIRSGGSVRGLTTAAALWVTAAVGTAVGFGFWDAAIATTVVTVVALYGLKWFERKTLRRLKRGRHEFAVDALPQLKITDLAGAIESRRARVMAVRMESADQANQQLTLFVQLPGGISPGDFLEALKTVHGVASASWLL